MDGLGLLAPPPLAPPVPSIPPPLTPRMAAAADRITTLKKEIARQKKTLAKLQSELHQIEAIPPYLADVTGTLTKHFGENLEWVNTITEAIKKNLNSIPKWKFDSDAYKDRYSYVWNGIHIGYSVSRFDNTRVDCEHKIIDKKRYADGCYGDCIRSTCIYTYKEKKWENFEGFDLQYIPILIAYMRDELSGIDNTTDVY